MTTLVTQKTYHPTRKILAVMVSGAVTGGIQAGLRLTWPDHPFAELLAELDVWIQMGVMALAGYIAKERANVAQT